MMVEALRSSRVLVVEDEGLIAEEIKDRLGRMGVNVVAMSATGEDAVRRAGELNPNIILMDIRLRGSIDGIEAASRIGSLYKIPIVYLTAHADDATLARAKQTTPYGYLLKPFEERDLRIALEMALHKHSTEVELNLSRELYAKTLAGLIEGVISADERARVTFMNPAAERMTQWNAVEAKGHAISKILNILNATTRTEVTETTDSVLATGEPLILDDVLLVSRDGSEIPVFDSIAPLRDSAKGVTGAVLVLRDLTEKKRADAALRDAGQRIQNMQKMDAIGRLAGGIAHDVGNMMAIVLGYGEFVRHKLCQNSDCHTKLESMMRAADHSATLARQLLAFSRKQALTPTPLKLNEVIENMRQMLVSLLSKLIQIDTRLSSEIPLVLADKGQIEQVIMNLSINARDAMPNGGTLTFETSTLTIAELDVSQPDLKLGRYAMLSVTDTGTGMTDEVKAHLFEPYFTTKKAGEGTGMGLAAVFGIIMQFNGSIDVQSVLGKGTTLRIFLPAISENAGEAAT